MPRGNYNIRKVTDEDLAKMAGKTLRLNIAYKEWQAGERKGVTKFTKEAGISYSGMMYQLKGEKPVSKKVENFMMRLGYTPEWVEYGTGRRKKGKEDKTNLTDIKEWTMRVEKAELELKSIRVLWKNDVERLKKRIERLEKQLP